MTSSDYDCVTSHAYQVEFSTSRSYVVQADIIPVLQGLGLKSQADRLERQVKFGSTSFSVIACDDTELSILRLTLDSYIMQVRTIKISYSSAAYT